MFLDVIKGDITKIECDAIVNPANSLMIMGGGVAGAIKRKGGDIIEKEAKRYAPVPVGKAISTSAGKLPAKYVIHSPTMERPAQRTTRDKVYKAIIAALQEALRLDVRCVAFPGMGTGVGGLSYDEFLSAFRDAIIAMMDKIKDLRIILVAFEDDLYFKAKKILRDFLVS